MNATVKSWTDSGVAETLKDADGFTWTTAYDASDGTIAVECEDGDRAGIFRRLPHTADRGDLYPVSDGATYGVNCSEEFIAENGEWIENGEEEP